MVNLLVLDNIIRLVFAVSGDLYNSWEMVAYVVDQFRPSKTWKRKVNVKLTDVANIPFDITE